LVAETILDCSKRGAKVLDSFGGSGTTLIAAERTGRRARMMELDAAYVDVTVRRYQKLTGEKAIHAETHLTFDETERKCCAHACSAEHAQSQDERK
jgi:DNA modification methylase